MVADAMQCSASAITPSTWYVSFGLQEDGEAANTL